MRLALWWALIRTRKISLELKGNGDRVRIFNLDHRAAMLDVKYKGEKWVTTAYELPDQLEDFKKALQVALREVGCPLTQMTSSSETWCIEVKAVCDIVCVF